MRSRNLPPLKRLFFETDDVKPDIRNFDLKSEELEFFPSTPILPFPIPSSFRLPSPKQNHRNFDIEPSSSRSEPASLRPIVSSLIDSPPSTLPQISSISISSPSQSSSGSRLMSAGSSSESACSTVASKPTFVSIPGASPASPDQDFFEGDSFEDSCEIQSSNPKKRKKMERQLKNTKRAEQNRAAQRAFRERRETYVKDLERKSKQLEQILEENCQLTARVSQLESILSDPPEKENWEAERREFESKLFEWEREKGTLKGEVEALKKECESYKRRLGLNKSISPPPISLPSLSSTPRHLNSYSTFSNKRPRLDNFSLPNSNVTAVR